MEMCSYGSHLHKHVENCVGLLALKAREIPSPSIFDEVVMRL